MTIASYIGVDPGAGGALALLQPDRIEVVDMPVLEIGGKRRIDLHALVRQMRQWALWSPTAIVENVGAMPGQSPNSMFNFGGAFYAVQTAIVAADIALRLVTPQVWKKHYGLGPDKDQARQLACRLFPQHAELFARKKDDGRAEAVLVANYGRIH